MQTSFYVTTFRIPGRQEIYPLDLQEHVLQHFAEIQPNGPILERSVTKMG
jgi:hypothetical protein